MLQYYKKVLIRDLIFKNLIINPNYFPKINNITLFFSHKNFTSQSQYLFLLHSIELFFNQKAKLIYKKKKLIIKLTCTQNFQIFNNINLITNLSINNKIKDGYKSNKTIDVFINKLNPLIENSFLNKLKCQLSINFQNAHTRVELKNFFKSFFIN